MSYWGGRSKSPLGSRGGSYQNPEPPGETAANFYMMGPSQQHQSALFPSAFASAATTSDFHHKTEEAIDVIDDDCQVPEQLFPPGKVADLQVKISKNPLQQYIGI